MLIGCRNADHDSNHRQPRLCILRNNFITVIIFKLSYFRGQLAEKRKKWVSRSHYCVPISSCRLCMHTGCAINSLNGVQNMLPMSFQLPCLFGMLQYQTLARVLDKSKFVGRAENNVQEFLISITFYYSVTNLTHSLNAPAHANHAQQEE